MKRATILLPVVFIAALSVHSLFAQSPDDATHAPSGGVRTMVVSIAVPPLPGAPFSATVTTEWKRTLDDGTIVTIGNHRTIARDGLGRIFQERRNLYAASDARQSDISRLEFADPRAHTMTTCWPQARICQVGSYYASAATPPLQAAGPVQGGRGVLSRVDLGRDSISGVDAIGTRETTIIAAGAVGNDRAINTVKEFWYSPQLGINLIEKRQDPNYGSQTFTVSDLSLGEPDPAMFDVPADFRVDDNRAAK